MSTIKEFIQNRLQNRMQKRGILVVYDTDHRYRELCLELVAEDIRVIDASESSIESREVALEAIKELGQPNTSLKGMLVYVPARAPLTDEEKQRDPFALYTVCGCVFPQSDSDEYLDLCLVAKPDYQTEIRRIFSENPNPSFAIIDAVGGGTSWPTLQTLLNVESARDILRALLVPNEIQKKALTSQYAWGSEARELFKVALELNLVTRSNSWAVIADELWRFVLFSEFVFDLPEALPESLTGVPVATRCARPLVEDLCDTIRNDMRTQTIYIEKAEAIEKELDLPTHCQDINNLGVRDTFPFEERSFLAQAVKQLENEETDSVRRILDRRENSVWIGKGESQIQWGLIRAALDLVEVCDDYERQLPEHNRSIERLIDYYVGGLRETDRLHRQFEQAVSDYIGLDSSMTRVIELARNRYRRLASKVQDYFIHHFENAGWPLSGQLANSDVFDRLVSPKLAESGHRVAFFLIDALRYELGLALEKQLHEDGQVEIKVALAQLPSVTKVGMASLLPEAGQVLSITNNKGEILPMLGEVPVQNVNQRMDVLRRRYGQRFDEMPLDEFVRAKKTVPGSIELLVLRSTHIDKQLELDPERALRQLHDTLKRIRVAIFKLKEQGFHDVIIATDHGFILNVYSEAGDVCTKPQGDWVNVHERCLLGKGTLDAHNFIVQAEHAGIRGEFEQLVGPKGLVPYRAGLPYFHGGVSLQELVLPVITLRLGNEKSNYLKPAVSITYKNGAKRITTRFPVIDATLESLGLFGQGAEMEILLEAHDKKGNVVGEAKPGGLVNPATGTITLRPGERVQVTLKMNPEYEGKFSVKALNPTTLASYCKIDLETDYVV